MMHVFDCLNGRVFMQIAWTMFRWEDLIEVSKTVRNHSYHFVHQRNVPCMDSFADPCEYLRDCLALYMFADKMDSRFIDQGDEYVFD